MTTRVAVVGANGTMGTLICRLIEASEDFELVARIGSADPLAQISAAEVVVDVTAPRASQSIVEHAIGLGLNVLVGTSGWTSERVDRLRVTVAERPEVGVLIIPNFSIGSAVATSLAAAAARYFESAEIVESHHRGKVDSPSGTSIRTAERMSAARGALGPVAAPHADQRARGQLVATVPVHSLRMDGVVAKQEVRFGGLGESLTIVHETLSAKSYESGIMASLRAAVAARGVVVGLENVIDLRVGNSEPMPAQ